MLNNYFYEVVETTAATMDFNIDLGDGVTISLLEPSHAEQLCRTINENLAYLSDWIPLPNPYNFSDAVTFIKSSMGLHYNTNGFHVAIWLNGELIGSAGFHSFDRHNYKTDMGYWISQKHQGKGIITKVVKKLIEMAFVKYGMNRVEIQAASQNFKSQAVPKRLGFKQDGILRSYSVINGKFLDMVVFSLLRSEWEAENLKMV